MLLRELTEIYEQVRATSSTREMFILWIEDLVYSENKRTRGELKVDEHIAIDPRILQDEKIARETLSILLKTKQELDEIIENLEILTNQELLESINKSVRAKKRNETELYTSEELKRELKLTDEDLKGTEDVEFEWRIH